MQNIYTLPLFEDTTDDELGWLRANSREVVLEKGEYFIREGERATSFFVVLEGELQITRTIGGRSTVMGTTPPGIIGNELPLLHGTPSSGDARALVRSRLMVFDLPAFRAIFANCPTVGAKILKIAAERTQKIAGLVKQQEKMAALGKLSAGLAHELNNPAAAARAAVRVLREGLPELETRMARLCAAGLDEEQIDRLAEFQREVHWRAAGARPLSTIEQSDREEELGAWLEERDIPGAWEIAPILVSAHLSAEDLGEAIAPLPAQAAPAAIGWLQQSLHVAVLLGEVEESTRRISELVAAIKSYTYMDQGSLQEVDIQRGLEDTLTVLKHKLRNATLVREYDAALPKIMGQGVDLNQVWTNLIDNAIDATDGRGTIRVITRCENTFVMVEIADDGPGIPAEVLPRIFDPFFTTKGVGQGTGMGLEISYRIVRQHNGTIEVQSHPGLTRFIVRLPIGAAGQ
jgi:signal transduction histidine kinase